MCASSPAESSLLDALFAVIAVLKEEEVAHALCGGVAANLYRTDVRATTDVDVYIICATPQLVSLARAFEGRGWSVHPAWRQAELVRLKRADLPLVDLLVAATSFERDAVERAITATIDGQEISVLVPEDLIVFKLVAGRARDYEAAAAIIIALSDQLDGDFIRQQLAELGMEDRWLRAVKEAELEAQGRG